jgi:hypothetical protein
MGDYGKGILVRGMDVRGMGKRNSSGWVFIPLTTIPLTNFGQKFV